jgi:adenosine deaminase
MSDPPTDLDPTDLDPTPPPPETRRLIEAMPKAELHLHLDGSVRVDTALELARSRGVDAPRTWAGMYEALVAPARCADQAELLARFDLPIALLQDAEALERVAFELVLDKAADRVRYVEIRWGPLLHTQLGLGLEAGIEAVCSGVRAGADLTGATVRLIVTALRSHDPMLNAALAEVAAAAQGGGVIGFDLAGPEAAFPDPLLHRAAFEAARAGGLHVTLHAGEWGGADQVRRALEVAPERIAHGPGAADDPSLLAELRERGVVLDLCPTSNVQAGIVRSVAEHPLARLHRAGVAVTLSTDDLTVSDVTLSEEYGRAHVALGLDVAELWALNRAALDAAFGDPVDVAPVRAELDAFEAAVPEVRPGG